MMAEAAFSTPFGFVWTFFASRAGFLSADEKFEQTHERIYFQFLFFHPPKLFIF
jgi:hypothetical protein